MSRLTIAIALAYAYLAPAGSVAYAKQRQKQETHIVCNQLGCRGRSDAIRAATAGETYDRGEVIGGRPSGCPRRYCGCGTSLKLFGRIRPELNLAWNWTRLFPRTDAAPNMAAVRYGHVMVLLSHVGGSEWLVYDANSGYGLIREHVRSIRGYVVVNPSAVRTASR